MVSILMKLIIRLVDSPRVQLSWRHSGASFYPTDDNKVRSNAWYFKDAEFSIISLEAVNAPF